MGPSSADSSGVVKTIVAYSKWKSNRHSTNSTFRPPSRRHSFTFNSSDVTMRTTPVHGYPADECISKRCWLEELQGVTEDGLLESTHLPRVGLELHICSRVCCSKRCCIERFQRAIYLELNILYVLSFISTRLCLRYKHYHLLIYS